MIKYQKETHHLLDVGDGAARDDGHVDVRHVGQGRNSQRCLSHVLAMTFKDSFKVDLQSRLCKSTVSILSKYCLSQQLRLLRSYQNNNNVVIVVFICKIHQEVNQ